MGRENRIAKMMFFWDYIIVPWLQVIYMVARYGLKGATKKADEELKRLTREIKLAKEVRNELKRN